MGNNEQLYRMSASRPQSYWFKVQNSMSRLDPIFECCKQRFYSREMNILERTDKFVSDEIINASMTKFLLVGQAKGSFKRDSAVILSTFALKGILDTLKPNENARTRKETTTEVVDLSLFPFAYEFSKDLWEYENIFSHQDRWFLTILNYPDRTHWMFLVMHSGEKVFFLYDPLYRESYSKAVKSVVELYINAEAESFASSTKGVAYESLKYEAWQKIEPPRSQKQPDNYSCGVLALIAFFRATVVISEEKSSGAIRNQLAKAWKCPTEPVPMTHYRQKIKRLLTEGNDIEPRLLTEGNDIEPRLLTEGNAGFTYFAEELMGYIKDGGALYTPLPTKGRGRRVELVDDTRADEGSSKCGSTKGRVR